MKYQLIKENRSHYPVEKMCKILNVSTSGFYKWENKQTEKSSLDLLLMAEIKAIYVKSRKTFGYIRVTKVLKDKGYVVNKKKVYRLMQEMGISGLQIKGFRPKTTLSRHNEPISPNLVNGNFQLKEKNLVWVSDITYIRVKNQWNYLCMIIDLGNREVVGWSFGNHMRTELVLKAMISAVEKRGAENLKDLIFHSDRGSQYASREFRQYLGSLGIRSSMSGKGNCYDNAVAESFFSTLKREEVIRKDYEAMDTDEARLELFDYIEIFYNRQRLHSALNYTVPVEFAA